jgi:hypothetical protein
MLSSKPMSTVGWGTEDEIVEILLIPSAQTSIVQDAAIVRILMP